MPPEHRHTLTRAQDDGAVVLHHSHNRGKGAALRTGLAEAARRWPEACVVTVDADGQHLPADVARVVANALATGHLTLGVRVPDPDTPPPPLRSRIGNHATAALFRTFTGWDLPDTQTGLRALPAHSYQWMLDVPGDRYEYELRILLEACQRGLRVDQVPIAVVYEPGNPTSHFRPLHDSARIWAPLLHFGWQRAWHGGGGRLRSLREPRSHGGLREPRNHGSLRDERNHGSLRDGRNHGSLTQLASFTAASAGCAVLDWAGVLALHAVLGSLLAAVVGARVVSASTNYFLGRRIFRDRGPAGASAGRYASLAVGLAGASYVGLRAMTGIGVALAVAKPLVDSALYVASYLIQRHCVFGHARSVRTRSGRTCSDAVARPTPHLAYR